MLVLSCAVLLSGVGAFVGALAAYVGRQATGRGDLSAIPRSIGTGMRELVVPIRVVRGRPSGMLSNGSRSVRIGVGLLGSGS